MNKKWYQSKGAIGGLLIALCGVGVLIGEFLQGTLDISTLVNRALPLIGNGLGILGIRFAMN